MRIVNKDSVVDFWKWLGLAPSNEIFQSHSENDNMWEGWGIEMFVYRRTDYGMYDCTNKYNVNGHFLFAPSSLIFRTHLLKNQNFIFTITEWIP